MTFENRDPLDARARRLSELTAENERLRAFAFGDAPEWEKANTTLKHQARDLEAKLMQAVALLREWGSCDPYSGQPYDEVVAFLAEFDA